mgnify:CR=1 FL=1
MDNDAWTEEVLSKVINSIPSRLSQAQMCDLIINMLVAYGMEEDFQYMSLLILGAIENINSEDRVRDGTIPIH